jgi:hypothetical protein
MDRSAPASRVWSQLRRTASVIHCLLRRFDRLEPDHVIPSRPAACRPMGNITASLGDGHPAWTTASTLWRMRARPHQIHPASAARVSMTLSEARRRPPRRRNWTRVIRLRHPLGARRMVYQQVIVGSFSDAARHSSEIRSNCCMYQPWRIRLSLIAMPPRLLRAPVSLLLCCL